jgi:tRNA-splicing endonuclease subunit Sen2
LNIRVEELGIFKGLGFVLRPEFKQLLIQLKECQSIIMASITTYLSSLLQPGTSPKIADQVPADQVPADQIEKRRKPNYASIHSNALPLLTHPLPAFIPHNPLSLFHVAYVVLSHLWSPPTSHAEIYNGYFSASTRSVHVTDPRHVRALWEMGFFGKGSLSRSEPTWLNQEMKRVGLMEGVTAEEITRTRRMEREKLKWERARVETRALQDQLKKESGILGSAPQEELAGFDIPKGDGANLNGSLRAVEAQTQDPPVQPAIAQATPSEDYNISNSEIEIPNQEHLQLSLEETFFLTYGLGALKLNDPHNIPNHQLLQLFRQHSYFPPVPPSALSPDDPFLLNYAVYHHFRSLGWVVRDGVKFAVDYLLYERGPVFKHAAFAVTIIPSYTHTYWQHPQREPTRARRKMLRQDWAALHCVNRVQSQVVKTLVLVYVDVPPPEDIEGRDVGTVLGKYRVREFCVRRWSANRNRD